MGTRRGQQGKTARQERAKRAERQRRVDARRCGLLLVDAELAWNARDVAQARRLLERVVRIRPNHQEANEHLAELHFLEQRHAEGLTHFDRLVTAPSHTGLIYQAAVACLFAGRFAQGATLASDFLQNCPRGEAFARTRKAAREVRTICLENARAKAAADLRESTAPERADVPPAPSRDGPRTGLRPTVKSRGALAGSTGSPRGETRAAAAPSEAPQPPPSPVPLPPQATALPPFPDAALPEVRVELESDRAGFPDWLPAADQGSILDVDLRRRYAELKLQQGFDELLSLGAVRDVEHFHFQLETVRRILRDFRGRALLADEVGLGKTIEACLTLKEYWMRGLVRKALVLTPPSLVAQWTDELASRFNLTPATPDTAAARRDLDGFWAREPLVVASLALVRQPAYRERLRTIPYDLIIVDEAHALKNRASAAWQLVNDLKKRFLLLLSATPVGNDLTELYNLILLLRPGLLRTEAHFRREYGQTGALAHAGRRDKLRALLREVMLRNTRAHIDLKLPRRLAATRVVQPGPAEADLLARLAAIVRDRYPSATPADRWRLTTLQMQAGSGAAALAFGLRDRTDDEALGELAVAAERVARAGGSAKTEALIALARRSADKKIVFTRFRATLGELSQAFGQAGLRTAVFHGGLSAVEKEAAITEFQEEAEILLSSELGGEGRNLQFCRTVINYDLPWNPMAIEQRVGRVHRIGQTREVYVFNFCLAGSVEERILRILHDKINLFELVAGEIEMILGHLDDEQDFAGAVMDAWARGRTPDDETRAFDTLSARLIEAQASYQRTRDLDGALFSADYEV
jgi:superfamily II DNA or RNA helicase